MGAQPARCQLLAALVAALLVATACGGSIVEESAQPASDGPEAAPAADAHEWDYFIFVPLSHPIGEFAQAYAEAVAERTDGRLAITVRPAGELPYRANDALTVVQRGDVELADAYVGFVAGANPIMALPGLPFLVNSIDELDEAIPVVEPAIAQSLERFNAELVFWYPWPMQNLFGRGRPVQSLEGLRGRQIRASAPEQVAFLEAVGASAVTLTTEEVTTALDNGVVGGVLTSAFNAVGSGWGGFLDWAYTPGVNAGPSYIVANADALAALPPDVRMALGEVSAEFAKRMGTEVPALEEGATQALSTEQGVTVSEGSEADAERGAELMSDYWETWASDAGQQTADALAEVRAALGK